MDEVVVLDSESGDGTVEKAKSLGARVAVRPFTGFVEQKNAAMDLCRGEWLFNVDADEEVTDELRTSIEALAGEKDAGDSPSVFSVTRRTWYWGRWIRHCGWYPEYRQRLSRRGAARWEGDIVHEKLVGNGPAGTLSGDLLHRPYPTLSAHAEKIGRYADMWARQKRDGGASASVFDLLLHPPARFMKMYVLRGGFLDGTAGFVASAMGAWYTFVKYARLLEFSRKVE